jgi:hypothetical protein
LYHTTNRWRELQLQLEDREDAHRQEIATMQLKFKRNCGSSDKQIAALAGLALTPGCAELGQLAALHVLDLYLAGPY